MKKYVILAALFNLFFISTGNAIDRMREFLACVDENLENDPRMDPKVAEDICSGLLDDVEIAAPNPNAKEGPIRSKNRRTWESGGPGSVIISREYQATDQNIFSNLTEELQMELSDANFQIAFFTTSAAASYSIWWMLRNNPAALLKTVARRLNPAAAILPPEMTKEFFNPNGSGEIILPGSEQQLAALKDWMSLSDLEKIQALQNDEDFAAYLTEILNSVRAQKFILINKNQITF